MLGPASAHRRIFWQGCNNAGPKDLARVRAGIGRAADKPRRTARLPRVPQGAANGARKVQDHIARWQAHWTSVQDLPWKPDADVLSALDRIKDEPVLWLSSAVNIMAFGCTNPPQDVHLIEVLARKAQAGRALCNAARQGRLNLIGTPVRGGDGWQPIERAYFDMPRFLGDDDNSIVTDMNRLSDEAFLTAQGAPHTSWFNVRLEAPQFASWLTDQTYSVDLKNGRTKQ